MLKFSKPQQRYNGKSDMLREQLVLTFKVFKQMCSEIHCLRGSEVAVVQKVRVL